MKNLLLILCLSFTIGLQAQNQLLKGRIVDANDQSGIAYTNIGIEGTFYGTASDANGFFELKIPAEFANKTLFVSAVGYENKNYPVAELLKTEFARLSLNEQTYSIEGIDVAARSQVLFRIIKTASAKVPENYHNGPIGLKFHYLAKETRNDSTSQIREAIAEMTDQSGYGRPSVQDAFDNRNFRFTEVNKNFRSYSFPDAQTGFDELIELDLARLSNTIFKEELIRDYDLQLDGIRPYEGDSVWVIAYKTDITDLAHTGDYYATKMDGKLFILKSNYALVRNECMIEASKNNPQNRSLYTEGNDEQQVRYHLTTLYREHGGKYLVSYFDQDKSYKNPAGEIVKISRKAALLDFEKSPKPITGRTYFEDSTYDEKFWNAFHSRKKL